MVNGNVMAARSASTARISAVRFGTVSYGVDVKGVSGLFGKPDAVIADTQP